MAATNEEVTDYETQALMKLKLEDSVREVIRKEILAAFNDTNFTTQMGTSNYGCSPFMYQIVQLVRNQPDFSRIVAEAVLYQLQK